MHFLEFSASLLRTFPGGSKLSNPCPLAGRYRVELVFAPLAPGQDVGGMQLSLSATARGFAALAAQQIKASRDQLGRFGHLAQERARGAELAPELATQVGGRCGHLHVICQYNIQTTSKKLLLLVKRQGNHP